MAYTRITAPLTNPTQKDSSIEMFVNSLVRGQWFSRDTQVCSTIPELTAARYYISEKILDRDVVEHQSEKIKNQSSA